MSSKEKLIKRFKSLPKDFTWDELVRLLNIFGFVLETKGKTSGSRIIFTHKSGKSIMLHKPHPQNTIKTYALRQVHDYLHSINLL